MHNRCEVVGHILAVGLLETFRHLHLREEYLRIREKMDRVLSVREKEALILYSSGYSYSEIAEKTGTTAKAVGNAIQRARKKLRQE